jgi:hypothetical protein
LGDPVSSPKEMRMKVTNWVACVLVTVCAIVASSAAARDAEGVKKIDGGKGSEFKSKKYQIKEKGEIAIVLSFEPGKEVTVTTKGEKETDINLFVKGKYFEAKDTSPGPECLVKFTPVKGDGKFTLTLKNASPGANTVTLEVKVAQ